MLLREFQRLLSLDDVSHILGEAEAFIVEDLCHVTFFFPIPSKSKNLFQTPIRFEESLEKITSSHSVRDISS